ncbi:MAG: diguanylate cyclase, partial [Nitrospirota bacterium]|nr:diguanylate cyclase [Nitrospirota bacterium]
AGDEFAAVGDDLNGGDPAFVFAEPITYGDQNGIYELGHLVTLVSDHQIRATSWARGESHLVIMTILALGLGIGVHIAYRYTIGEPLAAMVRAIRTARQTERPLRIAWTSPDEIGQLASALNEHVEREWSYKRELVAVNASLEERIMVRTQELSEALTQANEASAAIARLAMEDSLTGLPNRREFASRLAGAITVARRRDDVLAVMLIDLDRFKNINDALGHSAGDHLLKQMAERLQTAVGTAGTVARLGGDEFAVLALGSISTAEIASTARRIVAALDDPVTVDGTDVHAGGSIGISLYPTDGDTDETLMANADIALYRAKDGGRGRFCFFSTEMRAAMVQADRIETDLRHALDLDQLELFY